MVRRVVQSSLSRIRALQSGSMLFDRARPSRLSCSWMFQKERGNLKVAARCHIASTSASHNTYSFDFGWALPFSSSNYVIDFGQTRSFDLTGLLLWTKTVQRVSEAATKQRLDDLYPARKLRKLLSSFGSFDNKPIERFIWFIEEAFELSSCWPIAQAPYRKDWSRKEPRTQQLRPNGRARAYQVCFIGWLTVC